MKPQSDYDSLTGKTLPGVESGTEALDVLSRFVSAIEYTPLVAIQSFDRNGVVCLWNATSANIYGIPAQDALGKRLSDLLLHQGKEKQFSEIIDRIWATGQPVLPLDWQVKTPSGRDLWVYSTMFPVLRDGKVHQVFCMDIDITVRKREEQALLAVGANFRTLFERSAEAIMLIGDDRFLDVNPAALKLFGFSSKSGMVGRCRQDISPPIQPDGKSSKEKEREMMALVQKNGNHRFEWLHIDCDKRTFWAEELCTEIPIAGTSLTYIMVRDISKRKAAEQSLHLAAQVFENSHEGILIADKDQRIISINRALTDITGHAANDVIGSMVPDICAGMRDEALLQAISEQVELHDHWQGELWGRHRDGQVYPIWLSLVAVRDGKHDIANYIGILTDISQRKASEEKIRHMAEHDFLTGLPNRVLLLDRIEQAIVNARRNNSKLSLLFLDLDRFKNINDSFGHHTGDRLLQAVAERIKNCLRSGDTVSRLGGDEFVIMLVDVGSSEPIAHIADNILHAINMPYLIDGHEFSITSCIGISIFPVDGQDIDMLIKNADIAMYHAKNNGRDKYQFFDNDMNTHIAARIELENNLRNALKYDEFVLHYQPQINIAGNRAIGAEALIRWRHPKFGLLLPDQFISVAEECGLIIPLGDWVLRTACRQAKSWQENGIRIVVAVNLSVAQFNQKNLLQSIMDALQEANLEPQYLELEITESILMGEAKIAIETLSALRKIGVRIAIDDFGTGFSSLSYLRRIPIDKLKIDQSFVQDITVDPEDAVIINAIIVMAKSLNLRVIAEGVETLEQFQFLASHGCDDYQGYYSSKVLPPQELLRFLVPAA